MTRSFLNLFIMIICIPAFAQSKGSMNPDIGANALFEYRSSNRGDDAAAVDRNGFSVREAELQFNADVDPYWKFISTFSLHQEVEIDKTTGERAANYVFEPEELFVESLDLPVVTVKVGKFKSVMGKHNQLHTHAYPFIDAPLANQVLLGDEGLNDVGVSASVLLPLHWFSEVTMQVLSGHGEGLEYFDSPSAQQNAYVGRFRNLWDLSDALTFEFGLSSATGQNSFAHQTNLYGADATFKWRTSKEHALIWSAEGLERRLDYGDTEDGKGLSSYLQYQIGRWWFEGRGEVLEIRHEDPTSADPIAAHQKKQSLLIGFIPSEFSGVRLQYDHLDDGSKKDEQKVVLQFNYSIGAHPAHAY